MAIPGNHVTLLLVHHLEKDRQDPPVGQGSRTEPGDRPGAGGNGPDE